MFGSQHGSQQRVRLTQPEQDSSNSCMWPQLGHIPGTTLDLASQPGSPAALTAAAQSADITGMISDAVIPRLMLAHHTAPAYSARHCGLDTRHIQALLNAVLAYDEPAANGLIQRLYNQGVSPVSLYLGLFAPVARGLGEYWQQDRCSFAQTNFGACLLHQLIYRLGACWHQPPSVPDHGRRILLASLPGDRHGLGLAMVAECFRLDGWEVWGGSALPHEALFTLTKQRCFEVIGLSLSVRKRLPELAALLRRLRHASRNRQALFMLGGPVFLDRPRLAIRLGADATASNAQQATDQANRWLNLLSQNTA